MKLSEVNLNTIKLYLRIADDFDDDLILLLWHSVLNYISDYTGLTLDELDNHLSLVPVALLQLVNLYDNRTIETNEKGVAVQNGYINSALNLYCKNLIATGPGEIKEED